MQESLPALFLCGAYVAMQAPDEMGDKILQSLLYTDGWWAWYGSALLTNIGKGEAPLVPYGRVEGTAAGDYLDIITTTHTHVDKLLDSPRSQWPKRQDGKLNWLKKCVAEAESDLAEKESDLTKAKDSLVEVKADLENYIK